MIIPHSRPLIDERDIQSVTDVLNSGQIVQGEKVHEFEEKVATFVGSRYGVAVTSGTAALFLAFRGLGINPGDEVIIPSYVCSSLYMAAVQAGAQPKIVDISRDDFNLDARTVKTGLTAQTKAVVVPHMFGMPAELDELIALGVPIIEDCAQSLGASYKNQRVGCFGKLSIFSFYATKMIATGEGGMILTDDEKVYREILEIREYDKKSLEKTRFNFKMTDMQAAMGLSQMRKLNEFIERRREIAEIYDDTLSAFNVVLPRTYEHKASAFFRYVVLADGLGNLQSSLRQKGVICERPVWRPLHKLLAQAGCPQADYVYSRALSIPLYPGLTQEELDHIVKSLEHVAPKRAP